MVDPQERSTRNALLRQLPTNEYQRLSPHLEDVELEFKQILYEPGEPIGAVHFVEEGVISIITLLEDGGSVETGTIGNEGVVGISVFLGTDHGGDRALCQIAGSGKRLSAAVVRAERRRAESPLISAVLRFTDVVIKMTAQTAACNRAHTLEERLARWLLITRDRVGREDFALTQEFLAQMLGVRRPTVNIAGAVLQRAGLIRYSRGKVTILDREGLEAASCVCYVRIRDELARAHRAPAPY